MSTLDIGFEPASAADHALEDDFLGGSAYAAVYEEALHRKKKPTRPVKLQSSYELNGTAVYEDITHFQGS
jgi:hypothetical protein